MSDIKMPKRWSADYDGYMVERDEGDYVEAEDVKPLLAEIARLREQLHLANIDAIGAHAEANDLSARVEVLRELLAVYVHAHQTGNSVPPHIEAAARAALKEAPQ